MLLIITCILVNISSIVFAQSDVPKVVLVTENLSTTDNRSGSSNAIIGDDTPIDIKSSDLNMDIPTVSMAASSPSGVVITTVHTIGSGLVDLDTEMTANMGISSVYGSMWYESTAGKRTASLYRPYNGNIPFYNESIQFSESPGTVIWTCGSSGAVIFNYVYSYPFESFPTNFIAIVF